MEDAGRSKSCPISLHIPTSSIQFGPDIIDADFVSNGSTSSTLATSTHQTPRRPHPGGLDTLPEASHVNALSEATGPSPSGLPKAGGAAASSSSSSSASASATAQHHLDSLVGSALKGLSPPARSLAISRSKGYSGITVELTNERWRERWSRLCLVNAEETTKNKSTATTPWSGDPGGMGGSWEFLAHMSGAGGLGIPFEPPTGKYMNRSSSRTFLAKQREQEQATSTAAAAKTHHSHNLRQSSREAEEWRKTPTFHRGELNLSRYEETEAVTAVISPWLELDSPDEGIRLDSEIALRQEVAYASHIGVIRIILPPPSSEPACRPYLTDYARAIAGCLVSRGSEAPAAGLFMKLSIRLPISSPYNLAQTILRNGSSSGSLGSVSPAQLRSDDDWSWQTWHVIENICQYNSRISIALDLSAPLPLPFALQRWISEPVSHIWLPARAFLSNAKGYPVLSKASQSLLKSLMNVKSPLLTYIIAGSQSPPSHHTKGGQAAYEQYIRHLEKSSQGQSSASELQARGYADYLQAPLQPLFDDLEGQTYATFEADAIKYIQYEEAVYQALLSITTKGTLRIWVCGAGRGPLVDRCLQAAKRARKLVKIVALEKNINAIVGLRERVALEWGEDVVEVQTGDMRKIKPPKEKADMIVSELLGSFGDNELSPECLDGAQRFLKPDGICIPRSYTSFITPISTPTLHAKVLSGQAISTSTERANGVGHLIKAAETPYVVLLKAFVNLAASGGRGEWPEIQECWSFEHKGIGQIGVTLDEDDMPLTNSHNVRSSTHTFHIPNQGVCHGLAGYFEANLFGSVNLSIFPDSNRATKDMMSWFPIFFPFKEPIYLAPNSELDVHMWRITSSKRVWYEWMAEAFVCFQKSSAGSDTINGAGQTVGTNVSQRNASGSSDVTMDIAFQNAPLTPRIAEMGLGLPSAPQQYKGHTSNGTDGSNTLSAAMVKGGEDMVRKVSSSSGQGGVGSSMGRVENHADQTHQRFKVGMSALMNTSGRSSWVGM